MSRAPCRITAVGFSEFGIPPEAPDNLRATVEHLQRVARRAAPLDPEMICTTFDTIIDQLSVSQALADHWQTLEDHGQTLEDHGLRMCATSDRTQDGSSSSADHCLDVTFGPRLSSARLERERQVEREQPPPPGPQLAPQSRPGDRTVLGPRPANVPANGGAVAAPFCEECDAPNAVRAPDAARAATRSAAATAVSYPPAGVPGAAAPEVAVSAASTTQAHTATGAGPLPAGWMEAKTQNGRTYYYATGERTRWGRPTAPTAAAAAAAAATATSAAPPADRTAGMPGATAPAPTRSTSAAARPKADGFKGCWAWLLGLAASLAVVAIAAVCRMVSLPGGFMSQGALSNAQGAPSHSQGALSYAHQSASLIGSLIQVPGASSIFAMWAAPVVTIGPFLAMLWLAMGRPDLAQLLAMLGGGESGPRP